MIGIPGLDNEREELAVCARAAVEVPDHLAVAPAEQRPALIVVAMTANMILINRAPVLTLWASVVAERLGFKHDEALSLGKAVAGLTAQSKGQRLGIFKPTPKELKKVREHERGEEFRVELLGRALPAVNTEEGVRAVVESKPIEPEGVERYLESKFGDALTKKRKAMTELANALNPNVLAQRGFGLYEQFRPNIPEGVQG